MNVGLEPWSKEMQRIYIETTVFIYKQIRALGLSSGAGRQVALGNNSDNNGNLMVCSCVN